MTLKLKVPNPDAPHHLLVNCNTQSAEIINLLAACESPYVERSGDDVIVKDFFEDDNIVPDVGRYKICTEDRCGHRKYRICGDRYIVPHGDLSTGDISCRDIHGQELEQQLRSGVRNIVLILESPHRTEYRCGDVAYPLKPGRGPTGRRIDQCLSTVLMYIQEETPIPPGCHVIISNPIQFQASLYAIRKAQSENIRSMGDEWKTLKKDVLQALWRCRNIRQNFRERICRYNPILIINACTDDLKQDVRTFVEEWSNERDDAPQLYEIAHPSVWWDLRATHCS